MVTTEVNANHVKKWVRMVNYVVVVENVKAVEPEKAMELASATQVFPVRLAIIVQRVSSRI